jgi:hypothetical protein
MILYEIRIRSEVCEVITIFIITYENRNSIFLHGIKILHFDECDDEWVDECLECHDECNNLISHETIKE